tara:strand:+ start:1212 stop:8816 length:7605 start_codon:yes stop_codon:yes gene_type:complete
MPYNITLPSGAILQNVPDNLKESEVLTIVRQQLPDEFPAPKESSIGLGAETFFTTAQTGLEALLKPEEQNREIARQALLRQMDVSSKYKPVTGLSKVKDVLDKDGVGAAAKEIVSQIPSAIGEQVPLLLTTAASAKAGALGGGAAFGAYGALLGGVIGASTPIFLQLFGSNIERQASEKIQRGEPLNIEESRAFNYAVAGTASEFALLLPRFGQKIFGTLLGKDARKLFDKGTDAKEMARLEKLGKQSLLKTVAKGTVVGAGIEGATEVTQQMFERQQADLPLFTEDAYKEYAEALYGAALVGGPLGAVGSVIETRSAPNELRNLRKEQLKKKAEEERKSKPPEEEKPLELEYEPEPEPDDVLVQETDQSDPMQNFLGNVPESSLTPTTRKEFRANRKKQGRTPLKSYSMEDLFDSLDPQTYAEELDDIIVGKLQEKDPNIDIETDVTFDDINDKAIELGLTPGNDLFNNFVRRTVGTENIGSLSKVKRIALFEALRQSNGNIGKKLSTNSVRFDDKQYQKGLNRIKSLVNQKQSVTQDEAVQEVKDFTGLEKNQDAELLLRTAVSNKELKSDLSPTVELTYKTKDGNKVLEFENRRQAEKHRDKIKHRYPDSVVQDSSRVSYSIPEVIPDYLPDGMKIEKGKFGKEVESSFEIISDGKKIEDNLDTSEDVQKKLDALEKQKAKAIKAQEAKLGEIQKQIDNNQISLDSQAVSGEKFTRKGEQQRLKITQRIKDLEVSRDKEKSILEFLNKPYEVRPTSKKYKNVKEKFILKDKDGQIVDIFKTREDAESAALQNTDDTTLRQQINTDPDTTENSLQRASRTELGKRLSTGETSVDLSGTRKQFLNKLKIMEEDAEAIRKKLIPALEKIGLKKLGLNILKPIDEGYVRGAQGMYVKQIIHVALTAKTPMKTLKHEVIHALKELGAFTPSQYKVLEKKAETEWIKKYLEDTGLLEQYKRQYANDPDLDSIIKEEAIAEAFADYEGVLFEGETGTKPVGGIRSVFERIRKFFEALKNALIGRGFTSTDDIFASVVRGEFANTLKTPETTEGASTEPRTYFQLTPDTPKVLTDKQIVKRISEIVEKVNKRIQKDENKFTLDQVSEAAKNLDQMIEKGISGKDWYEQSAKEIMKAFDNDIDTAEKFIQMVAIYSGNREVKGNVDVAVKAWNQWAKGKPIKAGFESQNDAARELLEFGLPFGGRKINTFYRNFMESIDELQGKDSTIDLHMARMLFDEEAPTSAQYDLAESLVNLKAEQTGLKPRQVQAASWVAQKQKSIYDNFIKKGYHKNKTEAEKLRLAANQALVNYGDIVKNDNLSTAPALLEPITDILGRTEVVTAEAFPSTKLMEGEQQLYGQLYDLNQTEKLAFTKSLLPVVNKLKSILDIKSKVQIDIGSGLFEGAVNPNFLIRVKNDRDKSQAEKDARKYSRAMAYVFKQDSVPFIRPDKKGFAPAFVIDFKENIGEVKGLTANILAENLINAMGAGSAGFTITRPNQIVIVDFSREAKNVEDVKQLADEINLFLEPVKDLIFGDKRYFTYTSTYNVDKGLNDYDQTTESDRDTIIEGLQGNLPERPDIRKRLDNLFSQFTNKARQAVKQKAKTVKRPAEKEKFARPRFQFRQELDTEIKESLDNFKEKTKEIKKERKEDQGVRYSFEAEVKDNPNLGQDVIDSINKVTVSESDKEVAEQVAMVSGSEPIDTIAARIRQKYINQYEAIERLMLIASKVLPQGNDVLRAENSAISRALFSDFDAAVTSESFKHGIPVLEDGITFIKEFDDKGNKVNKGIMEIFLPLAEKDDGTGFIYRAFQTYMAGKRTQFLKKKDTYVEKLIGAGDIEAANKLEIAYPEFKQIADDYRKFNSGLVQYMIDTQVITPEMGKAWMQDSFYIPFYRQQAGEVVEGGPAIFSAIAGVKAPPKIKGGEGKLDDFFLNLVQNTRAAISAGMKNEAATKTIEYARKLNDPAGASPLAVKVNKEQASFPDVIRIREKGLDVYYKVADPLLTEAMQSFAIGNVPMQNFLTKPAQFLREMVTRDPGFMAANLFRDSVAAWFTSGAKGYLPIISSLQNLRFSEANRSEVTQMLVASGIGTGYEFKAGVLESAEGVKKELRERSGQISGAERLGKTPIQLWNMLEKGTTASDLASRSAVAERVLAEGNGRAEAVYQAMELMNFNRKGNDPLIRFLAATVPFLNARIQGLDVLYRAGFGRMAAYNKDTRHKAFMNRAGTMIMLSLAYYYLARDQEEYKTAEPEQRDNNWIIGSAKLPIPFELGVLFKVVPERVAAYFSGNERVEQLSESMTRALTSTLMFNPIPQIAKPALEVMTNYSFFTGEKIVGLGQEGIAARFQGNNGTSLFARSSIFTQPLREASDLTLGIVPDISPIQIDYMIRGYTGTLGSYLVMLYDSITRGQGDPTKPTLNPEQIPVFKRFFASPTGSGPKSQFYELRQELDKAVTTLNTLERSDPDKYAKYLQENVNLINLKPYIRQLNRDLKLLRDEGKLIREDKTMMPDVKQSLLNSVRERELLLLQNIDEIYKISLVNKV